MATARLRVFPHPEEEETRAEDDAPGVPVRLVDLYPLLAVLQLPSLGVN